MAENVAGMLAYFTIIPAIIFLLIEPYNRNRFVRFHSFQCLFTAAALIVLHIVLFDLQPTSCSCPDVRAIWGLLGLAELALWILLVVEGLPARDVQAADRGRSGGEAGQRVVSICEILSAGR